MKKFRILLAEDHPIVRVGLVSLFRAHEGWEVCGEATDGRDAVAKCRQLTPDLLVLDICLPTLNGVEVARQVLKNDPAQRILIFTDVDSEQTVRDCLEAGVRGWVFKSDGTDDLVTAVETMQQHKSVFTARVADLIMDGYLQRHRAGPTVAGPRKLSPREREVVQLLGEGKTTKEVATILNVALKTAETHRSNIMLKLKLHSIAELVLYTVKNEIVHVQRPAPLAFPDPQAGVRTPPLRAFN